MKKTCAKPVGTHGKRRASQPLTKEEANLPAEWEAWCNTGRYSVGHKRRAVTKCINRETGEVRGFYSDLLLSPKMDSSHSLYPSFEHTTHPKSDSEAVVEARIINDMKSHLSAEEFWDAIEHLFAVGLDKRKITAPIARRKDHWVPVRHYQKKKRA